MTATEARNLIHDAEAWERASEDEKREAWERHQEAEESQTTIEARIGSQFGNKRPRIQPIKSKTLRAWWTQAAGPYRTDKAARRMARILRNNDSKGRIYGVWQAPIEPGRETADWFVCVRVGQAPGPKRGKGK